MGGLKGTSEGYSGTRAVTGEAVTAAAGRGKRGSSRAHERILLRGSPYRSWTRKRMQSLSESHLAGQNGGGRGEGEGVRLTNALTSSPLPPLVSQG